MSLTLQLKRDTAANWTANNPTLAAGRLGIETDTRKFKFGDGATAWNSLPYASAEAGGGSGDVLSATPVFAGPLVTTAYAMPALVIDVTKSLNTKTVSTASTFTLSATPTANTRLIWRLTNSDAADRVMTIPSMVSVKRGMAITSFTHPASTTIELTLVYSGTTWLIYNDPLTTEEAMTSLGLEFGNVATKNIPINSQSAAYTIVDADKGKAILHPSADTTARIFTLPSNAAVPLPIGTAITFINQGGAGIITIAITTDVMRLAGTGATGSRTLAPDGIATAVKLTATDWLISGTNLT